MPSYPVFYLIRVISFSCFKSDHNVSELQIYFHEIPEDVMDKLIEEGTVLYVAGGLLIEHPLIQPYIKRVAGATDSVMGLPKALTQRLITEVL
nr:maf-like protein DDB_G0281937 isoform X2 [Ipomoea batatas]